MSDFLSAARYTDQKNPLPHQVGAWNQAWQWLSEEQRKEFLEMFRAAVKMPPPPWLEPCLKIIKKFEGCSLVAYECPAGIPTIGYGSTRLIDGPVRMGDKITQQMADELLLNEVEHLFSPGVFSLIPKAVNWKPNQQAALISFAYNVGLGAVEDSTLRRRINNGENPEVVVKTELPRWNKANGKVLAGLARRRNAEVDLFTGQVSKQETPGKVTPNSPFSTRLTPHIQLGEFALWQEDRRFDSLHQVETAAMLAAFLERVRTRFGGKPVVITSGYRPPHVNRKVGGASGSDHLFKTGCGAVDFYIKGADIKQVEDWCDKNWPFSLGYGSSKGFVHLGIRASKEKIRWDY